jgi:hypothetical protein
MSVGAARMLCMTYEPVTPQHAAELAAGMLAGDVTEMDRPVTVVAHSAGRGVVERRAALLPVYTAIVERIGKPTFLGGTGHGPSVRWHTGERTLLLAGDHTAAVLSVHDAAQFAEKEFFRFDRGGLPYTWQLDRGGPGDDPGWTFNGHAAAADWDEARERLELMLASWAEHFPVQAPGEWVGFQVRTSRDVQRPMVVAYDPSGDGGEFHAGVRYSDRAKDPGHAAEMRSRGWQGEDEHHWWRLTLPETDPGAPAQISRAVITDLVSRGTVCPDEVEAWDISAGDVGKLWVPGLGFDVWPRRGEHY